jgi:hypothetical protein
MFNGQLAKLAKIVPISTPKDYSSTAITAEWINMSLYDKVTFIIYTGAWAGGTSAVTINQATTNAGSGASVTFTKMFTGTTDALTETAVTSSTFNLSAASTLYVVEINADELDVDGGYKWVNITCASPSSNSDFYSVIAIVQGARYLAGTSSPTCLT